MSSRQRPLPLQALRAFEAVARHLSFRLAGEELFLTQSAISRQIQGLEAALGAQLFQRDTRQVALTGAGATLLRAAQPGLERLDLAVRQIRSAGARPRVSVTTFASFATLWLIPRLEAFQRQQPALDIRIAAHDTLHDMDDPDIDMALRYCHPDAAPPGALRLFDEVLTPVVSPWYLERAARGEVAPLRTPADLAQHTLLEVEALHLGSSGYRRWEHWLTERGLATLQPQRWVYLNYDHQRVQAAQVGQGVVLARLPLVTEMLARGELVEPFGRAGRDTVPYGYWLILASGSAARPEVLQLRDWMATQAAQVRAAIDTAAP